MLNSAEHLISLLTKVKTPTNVGISTFISQINIASEFLATFNFRNKSKLHSQLIGVELGIKLYPYVLRCLLSIGFDMCRTS